MLGQVRHFLRLYACVENPSTKILTFFRRDFAGSQDSINSVALFSELDDNYSPPLPSPPSKPTRAPTSLSPVETVDVTPVSGVDEY